MKRLARRSNPPSLAPLDKGARHEGGECPWQTTGQAEGATVTEDGPEPVETIRIVSARCATSEERRRYANG